MNNFEVVQNLNMICNKVDFMLLSQQAYCESNMKSTLLKVIFKFQHEEIETTY